MRCVFFLSFRARTERRFASCRLPPRPHQSIIIVIAIVIFTPVSSLSLSLKLIRLLPLVGGGEAARCGCCGGIVYQCNRRCAYRSSWRAPVMTFARGGGGGGLCHTDRPYPPPPAHPTPGSVPDSSFSSLPSKGTAAFSLVGRSVGRGYGTLAFKIFRRRWRPTRAATSVSASICPRDARQGWRRVCRLRTQTGERYSSACHSRHPSTTALVFHAERWRCRVRRRKEIHTRAPYRISAFERPARCAGRVLRCKLSRFDQEKKQICCSLLSKTDAQKSSTIPKFFSPSRFSLYG